MMKIAYYPPAWLWSRMVSLMFRFSPTDGLDLLVKTPRCRPPDVQIFFAAFDGDVAKTTLLLDEGEGSVYDEVLDWADPFQGQHTRM